MQLSGTKSWRFSHDVGQMPSAVLYVRDALRLPVESAIGVPPRLSDEVPDRSALLNADVPAVTAEWAAWWTAIEELEARRALGDVPVADLRAAYASIVEPETSSVLSDAFRPVFQSKYHEGCHWVDMEHDSRRRANADTLPGLEWHLIRDAAEAVAAEAGVDPGDITGALSVVLVEGVWGAVTRPGFAWCSLPAACDPRVCSEIIRATLMSGLTHSD